MSYLNGGFNKFLSRVFRVSEEDKEKTSLDFDATVESLPKSKIELGNSFSSKSKNLDINLDEGYISVKDPSGKERVRHGKDSNGNFVNELYKSNGNSRFPKFESGFRQNLWFTGGEAHDTTNLDFQTMPLTDLPFSLSADSVVLIYINFLCYNLDVNNSAQVEAYISLDGSQTSALIREGGSQTSDHLTLSAQSVSAMIIREVSSGNHTLNVKWRNSRSGGTSRVFDREIGYVVLEKQE